MNNVGRHTEKPDRAPRPRQDAHRAIVVLLEGILQGADEETDGACLESDGCGGCDGCFGFVDGLVADGGVCHARVLPILGTTIIDDGPGGIPAMVQRQDTHLLSFPASQENSRAVLQFLVPNVLQFFCFGF